MTHPKATLLIKRYVLKASEGKVWIVSSITKLNTLLYHICCMKMCNNYKKVFLTIFLKTQPDLMWGQHLPFCHLFISLPDVLHPARCTGAGLLWRLFSLHYGNLCTQLSEASWTRLLPAARTQHRRHVPGFPGLRNSGNVWGRRGRWSEVPARPPFSWLAPPTCVPPHCPLPVLPQ